MTSGDPLSLRERVAYGLGDTACNLFWKTFTMFLMFFYTDVFGLAAAAAGTMFLVTRIWDSVFDVVVGIIADRTRTRWGRFRPYLLWMAIPYGVFGVLTFTTPDCDAGGRLVYAYVTYTAMMLVYSSINVPYSALLGVISADSGERTSAATFRFGFAFAGALLVQFSLQPLVQALGGGSEGRGFQLAAVVLAVTSTLLFLICFAGTRERIPPQPQAQDLRADLRDLPRNVPWLLLALAQFLIQIASCARDGTILYYFKYYLGNVAGASMFMALGSASALLGILLVNRATRRIGKKRTTAALMLTSAVVMAATYWIRPDQPAAAYAGHIAINLCLGPLFPLIWAMRADAVDYSEWKTGRRATGLAFSASSMASKLGWAFGGALTGWMLGLFGFAPNMAQSTDTQFAIRMTMSFVPAIAAVLAALVMLVYTLDEPAVARIEADLRQRRQSTMRMT